MNQTFKILFSFGIVATVGAIFLLPSKKAFGNLPFINYYGGTEYLKNEVRGVRNNNPGNIRLSNNNWKGKIPNELNTDGQFEQFISYAYGVRALIQILRTYYYKYKLRTINEIINRYAPSNENRTKIYIDAVSKHMGIKPDEVFKLNKTILTALVLIIDLIENGKRTIRNEHIKEAMYL